MQFKNREKLRESYGGVLVEMVLTMSFVVLIAVAGIRFFGERQPAIFCVTADYLSDFQENLEAWGGVRKDFSISEDGMCMNTGEGDGIDGVDNCTGAVFGC